MLNEVAALAGIARDLVQDQGTKILYWPAFYHLYCDVNELIRTASIAIKVNFPDTLDRPSLVSTKSFNSPLDKWRHMTNEDFANLDTSVNALLHSLSAIARGIDVGVQVGDQFLANRLKFHLHPKSIWYIRFDEKFRSGIISGDGMALSRVTLSLARSPQRRLTPQDIDSEQLFVQEVLDISSQELRIRLADEGMVGLASLQETKRILGAYIKDNCKIEDLL